MATEQSIKANNIVTLPEGEASTLSFATADVKGMTVTDTGELVITLNSGDTLTITNFESLAQNNVSLSLSDGSALETSALFETLAGNMPAKVIATPAANVVATYDLLPGRKYQFNFDQTGTKNVEQKDGALVITFDNNSQIVLKNFDAATDAELSPELSLNGEFLSIQEFSAALRLATLIEEGMEPEEAVAVLKPATTTQTADELAALAQELAEIEPAAGEAGGSAAGGRGGFGFGSTVTAVPLGTIDPQGPIGPTALQFALPEFRDEVFAEGLRAPGPTPPNAPGLESQSELVYEDGSVTLTILGQSNEGPNVQTTIVISGIPSGWTVVPNNGGVYDPANGTVTYALPTGTTSFNGGPTLSPPPNSDQDIPTLTITATNTDTTTGLTSTVTSTIGVTTDAVADTPAIVAEDDIGQEGTPLDADIVTSVTDLDGSETITSIVIKGVPADFDLSAGTRDPITGDWTLTEAELTGLTVTPPANFVGSIDLIAISTATESNKSDTDFDTTNDTATAQDPFTLTWLPNPPTIDIDFPPNNPPGTPPGTPPGNPNSGTFDAENAWVKEDRSVEITVNANLRTGHGADEQLTVTVTGIDASWGFSAPIGTYDAATGTWTYVAAPGTNVTTVLTFTPPAQSDIDLSGLNATATAYVPATNTTSSADDGFGIVVDAVADVPQITANNTSGNENTRVAVDINGALNVDTDGSEIITGYQISGVPDGFAFENTAGVAVGTKNGTVWTFTPAEVSDLFMTSPAGHYGNVNMTATVFNTENPVSDLEYDTTDNNNQNSDNFTVSWKPVVDTPDILVNGGIDNAIVKEDGSVDVNIVANLGADSSPTEVLTVTVTGIDSAWGFSAPVGTYNAATGTWTVTLAPGQNLSTFMTFTPPANSDLDLSGLNATAQAYEPSTDTYAFAQDDFGIITDAVADAPTLGVADVSGEEGTTIPFVINTAVTDTDGSEIIETITVTGLPTGATLTAGTYDAGTNTWTLTPAQLPGLGIVVADGTTGSFTLTVVSTAFDQNTATTGSNIEVDTTDNRATATDEVKLTVTPDDVPEIVSPIVREVDETNLSGGNLTTGATISADFGADAAGATFTPNNGFFSGAALTSGGVAVIVTQTATGYTGTAGAETIFTLTLNPTTGAFTYTQQGTLDHPDTTDADDTIPLQFGFTATDGDGDAVDGVITINVKDDGPIARNDVNEYETIDGGATGNVITGENGGAGAADTASQDDATLVTQVSFGGTVVDVPAGGATINGAHGVLTIQQDGSYSYVLNATSPTSGTVVVTEHEFSETLGFPTLTEGQQISGSTVNNLGVKAGDLTVGSNGSGTVTFVSEGAGYNNTLGMYTVAADGTLQAATILIKNGNAVTAGSTAGFTANAGEKLGFFIVADGATANSNYAGIDFSTGTVSFVYGYGTAQERPANVNDDGGDVSLVYTKNGVETVLNGDIYHTTDRGGSENLNADGTVRVVSGLANTGDDNTLRIGFEDLPALGDKDYEDIIFDITYTGSTIVPKACPEDTFTYVITDGDGDTSTATLTLDGACPPVDVTVKIPNIDEIIDAVNPANKVDGVLVKEDGSVFVEVEANYVGGNGNETMTLTLTGVRPGWVLTGTGWTETSPGTYTLVLPQGERAYDGGFTVAPPANTDGDMTGLQITATVAGPDANDDDSSSESFAVITDAVIDTPTLTVGNANANEGQTVALNIATDIGGDRDGSEAITKVTISGLPTGASLNKGTEVGGVWTLAKSDLAGLTITVPNGAEGTYTLQVTTYAEEVNLSGIEADLSDNQTTLTKDITLTVRDGDQPILGTPVVKTVDETNLASGNLVVGHNVSANFGADTPGTFNANNGFFSSTTLTSGGVAVVVAQSGNGYVGTANGATVFTLTLNQNTGAFVYTQQGTFDHPVKGTSAAAHNDSITLEFGFNARDVDGDSVNGVITINVLDDGLTARNDVNEYETVDGGATGNVISGLNGGTGAADSLSQDDSNLVTQVRFEGNVVNVGAAGATITGDYGTLTIQQDGSYSYTLLPGASVGGTVVTGSTTVAMNPNSGDVAGTQTSLTKNGITVSIGPREGSSETVGVGDLKWHDVGDGPGIGIGSNGSSDNKVWPQGEKLIVDPADLASSMTFTLADVSTTNQGNPLSIRIHFEDGSSTVVKMNVPSTLPSSHMWDITIDSSSFGGKLIESAELFNKPGDKSVSFMLNNVTAEIPTTTTVPADCPEDVFTYVITDGDGDTSSATLTLDGSCPTLIVGKNVDDRTGSTTDHYIGGGEGAIVGSTAGDILVGDIGGSSMVDAKGDYNIVLILDTSGSMGSGNGSRLDKLQKAVNNLLSELNDYNGGTIKVHIVPFNTDDRTAGTFTVTSDAGLTSAISFVNNMPKDGWTNYEAGMDAAIKYYDSSAPIDGAQNITYFISDGEPNHAITNNGNVQSYTDKNDPADWAMGAIGANTGVGGDGSNEITALQARSEVIGVGISLSNNAMANINLIDSNGSGVNVQNPDDLTSTLSGLNPISQLNASGDDVITGGDGNDIIYGDNVNTDALAADKGLGTAPGAGWAVFDQLEAGSTGWTRADTIEYITTQAQRQAAGQSNDWTGTENFGADGNVRAGGDDTLNGGAGDDIIFGQNGNDTIRGGADDDYIDGGVGNDVIYGDDGDDVLYGWTGDDIISGGAGNDDLVGEAGNDTLTGGAGADTFWYLHPQPGVDTIKDFKVSEGDTLELSELLSGHYDPLQDAINDFVFTRTTGGNTVVSIDLTGSGNAANAVDITVLEGVSTTLNDLVNSNSIVTV